MDHAILDNLKKTHTALKLLNADNMPLIISFFYKVFIFPNKRSLSMADLCSLLDDYLFHLKEYVGESRYPRPAKAYIEEWASGENAFLRKYYSDTSDEALIDLTPAVEKVVEWLQGLRQQQFVGTESRLLTIFELLKDIVYKTDQDPENRIKVLEEQKKEIDQEIEKIKHQGILPYDATQVKERFFQVEDTARKLLSDFRQVEHNFRKLDRETRERIAKSDKTKGALLDEIFHDQDVIWDSDQGKSFKAFWEFLMSEISQKQLHSLLKKVNTIEEIQETNPDPFLFEIQYHLMDAGEKVHNTSNLLTEQLGNFLDEQTYLENRRIMDLIKGIEKKAIDIRENSPKKKKFTTLPMVKPQFDFTMGRRLFTPPKNPVVNLSDLKQGKAHIKMDALYNQVHIDIKKLKLNIQNSLETRSQVSLSSLVETFPVENGLAELLAYLNLAFNNKKAMVNDIQTEIIFYTTNNGVVKEAQMPQVIFTR
jgi:hypothetical protein